MKMDKCKLFGHKWMPLFIKGEYNGKTIKFIACYCKRCQKGYNEVININEVAENKEFGTYNEKYFDR